MRYGQVRLRKKLDLSALSCYIVCSKFVNVVPVVLFCFRFVVIYMCIAVQDFGAEKKRQDRFSNKFNFFFFFSSATARIGP